MAKMLEVYRSCPPESETDWNLRLDRASREQPGSSSWRFRKAFLTVRIQMPQWLLIRNYVPFNRFRTK
jgi:hypothetical protein